MERGLQEGRGDLERLRAQEGVALQMEAYQEHAKEMQAVMELRSKMSEQEKMLGKGERQVRQIQEDMSSLRERPLETGGWASSIPKGTGRTEKISDD